MNAEQREMMEAQQAEQRRLASIASDLVGTFIANPVAHAVWVRTEVDGAGEFVNRICASVRPGFESRVHVPDEHQGEPITLVPWPEEDK